MNFLENLFVHYKTSVFGFIAAGAAYVAHLNGPHANTWAQVAAISTVILGAVAADAKKVVLLVVGMWWVMLGLSASMQAQTPQSAYQDTKVSFNLSSLNLPGTRTLSGVETDVMMHATEYTAYGETTLVATSPVVPFVGGRFEHAFSALTDYLQNHTALTGPNFQIGVTYSLGVVKSARPHWGERAGIFLKYAPAKSEHFDLALDLEWNNLPGIAHNIPSVVVGPNFRF